MVSRNGNRLHLSCFTYVIRYARNIMISDHDVHVLLFK